MIVEFTANPSSGAAGGATGPAPSAGSVGYRQGPYCLPNSGGDPASCACGLCQSALAGTGGPTQGLSATDLPILTPFSLAPTTFHSCPVCGTPHFAAGVLGARADGPITPDPAYGDRAEGCRSAAAGAVAGAGECGWAGLPENCQAHTNQPVAPESRATAAHARNR